MNHIPQSATRATIPIDEIELLDWFEITETIALLEPSALGNWVTALTNRFNPHPESKRALWSRLSLGCRSAIKAARGGAS